MFLQPKNIRNTQLGPAHAPKDKDRSKYRHLFFDLDHTLWDFEANSKATLKELHTTLHLGERGVNDFDLFHKNYLQHNEKLWERYRKGYVKQEELRIKRMWLSLLDFKIADDELAQELSVRFLDMIGRAAIGYPWIFNEIKHFIQTGEHQAPPTIEQRVEVISQHLHYSVQWKGLLPGINEMRRHYTNYLKGLPNIKEYRLKLVTVRTVEEIDEVLNEIVDVYAGYKFERRELDMEAMAYSCG